MYTFPRTPRNHSHFLSSQQDYEAMPKPGEIWMMRRDISEFALSGLLDYHHFSEPARHFIQGHGPSRYVMIVGDVRLLSEYSRVLGFNGSTSEIDCQQYKDDSFSVDLVDPYWVSVMVLGNEQNGINLEHQDWASKPKQGSSVDVLIPAHLAGLNHDVIAETWHIVPMLVHQLSCPVGHRLSSSLYNHLMDIGDTAFVRESATAPYLLSSTQLQSFHRREQQWSEVLRLPITACHMQFERLEQMTSMMEQSVWIERFSRYSRRHFH